MAVLAIAHHVGCRLGTAVASLDGRWERKLWKGAIWRRLLFGKRADKRLKFGRVNLLVGNGAERTRRDALQGAGASEGPGC